ncbi:MAG: hypothetical protein HXN12_00475 [Porphyromonadaceae bacterium]|nr:hypothetical protein [Porphyromonadaceae bacterium]
MQIVECNHKTVAKLLKKSVEKFWLDNNRDAYIQFTDGSVVCIHVLDYKWETYVALDARKETEVTTNGVSFNDSQEAHLWYTPQGDEHLFTARTVSIDFDTVRYYINDKVQYPTRQCVPTVEFHYYEKGETWE